MKTTRLGVLLAVFVVAGCDDSSEALDTTNQIDERGGTVEAGDSRMTLNFPSGALSGPTEITVEVRPAAGFPRVVSSIYELGPDGIEFDQPVTLRIGGLSSDEELTIAQIDGEFAIPVENAQWNPAAGEVVAELDHFSSYAVIVVYTPCSGMTCGDTCKICDPLDPMCVEPPPAMKRCNQSGLCVDSSLPICADAGVSVPDAGFSTDTGTVSGGMDAGVATDTGIGVDAGPALCGNVEVQRPQPLVDVLLVIDTTGSMGDEQASLAAGFPLLLQTLQQNNTDFRIGVITTDIDGGLGRAAAGQGTLAGIPPILTATTPNLASAFSTSVQFQLSGGASIDESGLLAAELSLTNAAGFHRAGSSLTVVFLSDEPDQSPDPVVDYVDALLASKGPYAERRLQLNHITGPAALSCRGSGGGAGAAPRYHAAGQATGGAYSEICSPPYSQALTDLGPPDYGYEFIFNISQTLTSTSSIEVSIDGLLATDWTYDATLNAVVFPPTSVPPPSSTVEIKYPCP